MAIYSEYQYRVDGQGYEIIERTIYIKCVLGCQCQYVLCVYIVSAGELVQEQVSSFVLLTKREKLLSCTTLPGH
jgi:hypothetical protein